MEYKRILSVQDISCLGQCSQTVALPILSVCGHETCVLPTVLLSTHTGGFQRPAIRQLADFLPDVLEHWQREGIRFDAVYTGYLGSIEAVRSVSVISQTLLNPEGFLIVDPAMADNGRLYAGFDDRYVTAMTDLCGRADVLLPNVTEAAILAGIPYEENPREDYGERLLKGMNAKGVVLTGIGSAPDETGALVRWEGSLQRISHPMIPHSFHGTGDIFASCFVGAFMRGKSFFEAAEIACRFVYGCVRKTYENPAHQYGVKFETVLPELIENLK